MSFYTASKRRHEQVHEEPAEPALAQPQAPLPKAFCFFLRSKEVKPDAEKAAEKVVEKAETLPAEVEKPQGMSGRLLGSAIKSLLKQFDSTAAWRRLGPLNDECAEAFGVKFAAGLHP